MKRETMFRIGYGWDSHEFKRGIPLKIGGVKLPHDRGLSGHSDGDVLLHALTDALLGAVAGGDIGAHFPPSDQKWKGADSATFVRHALKRVASAGYSVANVDSTLILAAPKIGPHARKIQARVAELLRVPLENVGIKAKTPEGMGTDNAAIAHVVVLLVKKRQDDQRAVLEEAEETPQPVIDDVVEKVLEGVSEPEKKKASTFPKITSKHRK
ncbi:MAG TPA: 2-C-methyl-D-erythritol 2,4-cyclodiphosphate synthase [Terriglobales bacterium]|nr:2-C-methyl-D-erythritol 2,4-cyclodiphosphate synthase [Terriglobales bacterium]